MNIEGLVVSEAYRHIYDFGTVRNMEPLALHILKTSENPRVAGFRHWMRATALKQAREAEREQKRMNDEFAQTDYSKKSSIRRSAVIHPYYTAKASINGDSWQDKKFMGKVRRENPKCFPTRDNH